MEREKFLSEFERKFSPDPSRPVVIGVSGGADSLCLFHLLKHSGLPLIPVHLDHLLRESSAWQAQTLKDLLLSWGYDLLLFRKDVRLYAENNRMGIEEAARACRYETLFQVATQDKAQAVLSAHQCDDQVETVLMHFLRGSGLDGLSGMRPKELLKQFSEEIPLWRPLLDTPRKEIEAYCREQAIEPIDDESNQSPVYFRNRLRLEVIPYLEGVQKGFPKTLARNAKALQLDRELLEDLTSATFEATVAETYPEEAFVFDLNKWSALARGLKSRLLMRAAQQLIPDLRDLGFEAVERVLNGLEKGRTMQDLKADLVVELAESRIIVSKRGFSAPDLTIPQLIGANELKLQPKSSIALANGWSLKAEIIPRKKFDRLDETLKNDPAHAWLNPSDLELPMTVRAARTGERCSPLGMILKRQKLSDFFINQKIPRSARAGWPIVTSGGSILWVVGKRIAQPWRLLGDESEILHLELVAPSGSFNP